MSNTNFSGFYGIAFQPYVGPWIDGAPVYFNTYSQEQVTQLLTPIAQQFKLIATYGQGTFVWQGTPNVQDSNRLNIQVAKNLGLKVAAGCFQQGANSETDTINVDWTKTEIDYAIGQATQYGNVVEIIVGNECLWGPNSTQAIIDLIAYAKTKRDAAGFTSSTLPITTRQRWDVLGGVDNTSSGYATMQQALLKLLNACEGLVYANMYAYFDSSIAGQIGPNPTQAVFNQAVTQRMDDMLKALRTAFSNQHLATEIRIGETGWPTQGTQTNQPDASIASVQNAQWHCEAINTWAVNNTIKVILFDAYDEPWKSVDNANSETHFGVWQAIGTASSKTQYTLNSVQPKF